MNAFHLWIAFFLLSSLLGLVLALIWFSRKALTSLRRASKMALQAAEIPAYRHSEPHIPNELARARRYQRPLTVAVLGLENDKMLLLPESSQAGRNIQVQSNGNGHGGTSSYLVHALERRLMKNVLLSFPFIGYILRNALRESDIVTFDAVRNEYVVALPEITKSQAVAVVRRLESAALKNSSIHLRVGLAEFPIDGLTAEDLLTASQLAFRLGPVAQDGDKAAWKSAA